MLRLQSRYIRYVANTDLQHSERHIHDKFFSVKILSKVYISYGKALYLFDFNCHLEVFLISGIFGHEARSIGQMNIVLGPLHFQLFRREVSIKYISPSILPPIQIENLGLEDIINKLKHKLTVQGHPSSFPVN